jgi:hypothetical protein
MRSGWRGVFVGLNDDRPVAVHDAGASPNSGDGLATTAGGAQMSPLFRAIMEVEAHENRRRL